MPILAFFALGVAALSVKLVKVLMGKWKSTENVGRNAPSSVITSPEMEKELHVYKCGGCGYEIYPARGREFKFFPDSFKCPLCGSSREAFFDKNDATDERNQEFDEDGERDDLEPAGLPDFGGPGAAGASTGPAVSTAEATADAPEPKPE